MTARVEVLTTEQLADMAPGCEVFDGNHIRWMKVGLDQWQAVASYAHPVVGESWPWTNVFQKHLPMGTFTSGMLSYPVIGQVVR